MTVRGLMMAGISLVIGMTAGACSSDGSGGGTVDTVSKETAATTSVESARSMKDVSANPSDDAALGKVVALYGQLQTMTGSSIAGKTGGLVEAALAADCVTQNGGDITYANCSVAGSTVDGSIKVSGSQITIDLTIKAVGATITEKGTLTVTDTSIDGSLKVVVSVDSAGLGGLPGGTTGLPGGVGIPSVSLAITLDATYAVKLTGPCPTSGTLTVKSTTSGLAGATGATDVTVTATFDGCGKVTVQ